MAILSLGNNNSAFSGSFSGSFEGNGTNLNLASNTTIPSSDPFPFTGDAQITGSLTISGSNTSGLEIRGPLQVHHSGSPSARFSSNSDTDEEVLIYDSKIIVEDSGYEMVKLSGNLYGSRAGVLELRRWSTNDGAIITSQPTHTSYIQSSLLIGKSGTVTTTHPYKLDVDGDIKLGNGTDDSIEILGPVTSSTDISSSAASTASFGHYIGDGSQLTNLPAATAGSTAGRVVFTTTDGALTTDSGFDYNSTTNQLTVESLNVTHFTSSFITSSRVLSSGSNILGDEVSDTQTLIGTTKMTGSAQVTGSLGIRSLSSGTQNLLEITNNGGTKLLQVGNTDIITIGSNASATSAYSQVWGGNASSAGEYGVVIGYDADHTAGTRAIAIGASAKAEGTGAVAIGVGAQAQEHSIVIGRNIADASSPINSVVFSTFGGNNVTYSTSNAFEWYNTHATTPNLRFLVGPNSSSYWSASGNFGFGTTSPDAPLTVEGSGSTVFNVIGSEGTLFSVDDDLDGTIFTANDRSGLPVLEASASGEVYIGKTPQSLYTTAVISSTTAATTQSIFGLSTSSYGGAFFDYTVQSGSNARAGSIMSVWNGSNISFTETTTTDIGDTTDFNVTVHISQSQAQIASHASRAGYNIKTIIRSI